MHCFTGDDSVNDYRYLTSLVHHFGAHIIHGGYLSVWHLSLDHGLPTVKIVSSFCDHVIFLIIIHIRFPIHWPWNCTCHRHVSGGHHGYKFDGEWTASTIGFRAITLLLASNVRQNIGRVIPLWERKNATEYAVSRSRSWWHTLLTYWSLTSGSKAKVEINAAYYKSGFHGLHCVLSTTGDVPDFQR
jgi:hypothetical protein